MDPERMENRRRKWGKERGIGKRKEVKSQDVCRCRGRSGSRRNIQVLGVS